MDFSRPPIETLLEAMSILRERGLDKNFDILIDGGIRCGMDIIKALCLGAKGCGIASPFLYANSLYVAKGVKKAIDLLVNELTLSTKLLGVTKLSDLNPDYIDISNLYSRHLPLTNFNIGNDVHNGLSFNY